MSILNKYFILRFRIWEFQFIYKLDVWLLQQKAEVKKVIEVIELQSYLL